MTSVAAGIRLMALPESFTQGRTLALRDGRRLWLRPAARRSSRMAEALRPGRHRPACGRGRNALRTPVAPRRFGGRLNQAQFANWIGGVKLAVRLVRTSTMKFASADTLLIERVTLRGGNS